MNQGPYTGSNGAIERFQMKDGARTGPFLYQLGSALCLSSVLRRITTMTHCSDYIPLTTLNQRRQGSILVSGTYNFGLMAEC